MKCPKCGFISFDDLSTCTKCSTDLSVLAKDLRGTGTETEPEFFLGSAIKNTNLDFDDTFSSTQTLPPLESDVELDFDDTSNTGQGISFSANSPPPADVNLDNTGDVALELGEIMPIDLSQLDSTMEISALASQSTASGTESQPDDATMAMDLDDLTSQNLTALTSDESIETTDLTAQLADLEEPGDSADENLDETMILPELDLEGGVDEERVDDDLILPDLDAMDIDLDELNEGDSEESLDFDSTAVSGLELGALEDEEAEDEQTAQDEAEPRDLHFDDIDLSDLVSSDDSDVEEIEDNLADINLDRTADSMDLSSIDDSDDEPPLPSIPPAVEEEVEEGDELPALDMEQLAFDKKGKTGEYEPIVDLSSLIEDEGVQDESDTTIELDLLSDEPIPAPNADATQDLPEIELEMTPIEDEDTPPDLPE